MKKYDIFSILAGLFIFRIILLSGSISDTLCLIAVLAYQVSKKYLDAKSITNEALLIVNKNHELTQNQLKVMAEEVNKAKVASEGLKAAMNIGFKK